MSLRTLLHDPRIARLLALIGAACARRPARGGLRWRSASA